MKTTEAAKIEVPYPETEAPLLLRISVGACHLRVTAAEQGATATGGTAAEVAGAGETASSAEGAAGLWVSGTYDDPGGGLPEKIVDDGRGSVRITQKGGLSSIKTPFTGAPRLELVLGRERPFALTVEAGGSDSVLELGGLPLTSLALKKGAGKSEVDFSEPNPVAMDRLDISAGAVNLVMRNLVNANFTRMALDGGAASYEFDFDGELRRDAAVKLTAGASAVKVRVPGSTAAKIVPGSVLGSLDIGDGLAKKEGAFWNEAALAGKSPLLTINASMALGSLSLQVTGGV